MLFLLGIFIVAIALVTISEILIARLSTIFDLEFISSASGRIPKILQYLQWIDSKGGLISVIFGGLGYNYSGGAYEVTLFCVFVIGGIFGVIFTILPIIPNI